MAKKKNLRTGRPLMYGEKLVRYVIMVPPEQKALLLKADPQAIRDAIAAHFLDMKEASK